MNYQDITLEYVDHLYNDLYNKHDVAAGVGWRLNQLGMMTPEMQVGLDKFTTDFKEACSQVSLAVAHQLPARIQELLGKNMSIRSYFPLRHDRQKGFIKADIGMRSSKSVNSFQIKANLDIASGIVYITHPMEICFNDEADPELVAEVRSLIPMWKNNVRPVETV